MKHLAIVLTGLAAVTAMSPFTASGAIQVNGVSLSAGAYDGQFQDSTYADHAAYNQYSISPELNGSNPVVLSALSGDASNTTTVTLTSNGAETVLSHEWVQQGSDALTTGVNSNTYMVFTPTKNLFYSLSGYYNVADPNGIATTMQYSIYDLADPSIAMFAGDYRFNSYGPGTPDVGFTLREGGNEQGSLTGLLLQGHQYELRAVTGFSVERDGLGAASAYGMATLTLTDPSAVPEPTQLAVWLGLGLCGAIGYRLRRTPLACRQ